MRRVFLSGLVAFFVAGCAAPVERIASTASGNPEVQVDGHDVDVVKARLLDRLMNAGFQIDNETSSTLVASKEMTGMQESLMRITLANSYATPVRAVTSFTFVKTPNGTKVFARNSATTTMAFGQVRRGDLSSATYFNATQASLNKLKESFDVK